MNSKQAIDQLNAEVARLYNEGDYRCAVSIASQARDLARQHLGTSNPGFAKTLNNLGSVYVALGDYAAAIPPLQESLDLERRFGVGQPGHARALANLGTTYLKMGDHGAAASALQEAVEIFRSISAGNERGHANSLVNLAAFYECTGHYSEAEALYQEASRIQTAALGQDDPDLAVTLNNLGLLYHVMGKYADAEPLFTQALQIKRTKLGARHPSCAGVLVNQAELYRATGRYEKAEPCYEQAADIVRSFLGEKHPDYAQILNNQGLFYKFFGNYPAAEEKYRQGLAIWARTVGEDHPDYVAGLHNLAAVAIAMNRLQEAEELFEIAAAKGDRLIAHISSHGSESQRLAYLQSVRTDLFAYLSFVHSYLSDSPSAVQAAFRLVLRRKAITAEVLAAQRDTAFSGRYPELAAKLRELSALRQTLAQATFAGPGAESLEEYQRDLADRHRAKERLEAELARHVPQIELERKLYGVDCRAVSEHLPAGALLIEFVRFTVFDFKAVPFRREAPWKPSRYIAFAIAAGQRDGIRMIDLGEAGPIDALVAELRSSIASEMGDDSDRDMFKHPGRPSDTTRFAVGLSLRQAIFDKIVSAFPDCKRLFLAPDGDLSLLPLEVLPADEHRHLLDVYHISYIGCGRDVVRFTLSSTPPAGPTLVIADPDFDLAGDQTLSHERQKPFPPRRSQDFDASELRFPQLPGTRQEAESIAKLLGTCPWVGSDALEARFKTIRSPYILHVATHGFFLGDQDRDPNKECWVAGSDLGRFAGLLLENPLLRSGLAFAGVNTWLRHGISIPEAEDGLLTAEDVLGMDLLDTMLVVLSACETGLGEVHVGEGVFGLRRSFTLAGAKTLVMSLWKVPDDYTRELMEEFYRRLMAGRPCADALRGAQLHIKSKVASPYAWGAFICQGDPALVLAQPEPSSSEPRTSSDPKWYYSLDGKRGRGPVPGSHIRELIRTGKLTQSSKVSRDAKHWHPASHLKNVQWPGEGSTHEDSLHHNRRGGDQISSDERRCRIPTPAPAIESPLEDPQTSELSHRIARLESGDCVVPWDPTTEKAFREAKRGCFTLRCVLGNAETVVLGLKMSEDDCAVLMGTLPIEFAFKAYSMSSGVVLVWGFRFFDRPDDPFPGEHLIDPVSESHVHHVRLAIAGLRLLMPLVNESGRCVATKEIQISDELRRMFEAWLSHARREASNKRRHNFQASQNEYTNLVSTGDLFIAG